MRIRDKIFCQAQRDLPSTVYAIILLILYGWGLTWVWEWFVVPLGVEPINTAHAIGIMAAFTLFRGKTDLQERRLNLKGQLIVAAFFFFVAWIAHFFV